ncbi:helix-turn-helix domain-containing protein [Paenibacillus profundus]|uniref:Helix-turn-helix domain-containing protein n=1 Tax=Paenibacillus profundus TaxID=1173085 RepID=A0ABS8YIV0_9BACL|nr:helix-turn-helix transcriptional regulator [Paenibacillus profundus]MCE5171843.1 helix-turn-helix domain-containing protein [Paenibacillus profundus]
MKSELLQFTTIGDFIKKRRQEANLTMAQLEELTGVSKGTISKIENGETKRPDFKTIHALASTYNIPFPDIVQLYLSVEQRADVLFPILKETVISYPSLSTKIAAQLLRDKKKESYELVEELYKFTGTIMDSPSTQLSLYKLIIEYSRTHGIQPYLAKALLQQYLIERDDFTKLASTYESGKYVLYYANFLSAEERVTLYFKLGVHAYNLRLFEDSIGLCNKVVKEHTTDHKLMANSIATLYNCYFHLGRYDLFEEYLNRYSKYSYPEVKDYVKFSKALLHAKKGDTDFAISQLEECLLNCEESAMLHIVIQLLILYLKTENRPAIQKLLEFEERLSTMPYHTPYKKSDLARFYKLKGDYHFMNNDFESAIDSYLESALRYARVNDITMERECVDSILNLYIRNNEKMNVHTLKRLQVLYQQCNSIQGGI